MLDMQGRVVVLVVELTGRTWLSSCLYFGDSPESGISVLLLVYLSGGDLLRKNVFIRQHWTYMEPGIPGGDL